MGGWGWGGGGRNADGSSVIGHGMGGTQTGRRRRRRRSASISLGVGGGGGGGGGVLPRRRLIGTASPPSALGLLGVRETKRETKKNRKKEKKKGDDAEVETTSVVRKNFEARRGSRGRRRFVFVFDVGTMNLEVVVGFFFY